MSAEAYFGEGEPMSRRSQMDVSHSRSGRRHKQADRSEELAEGGFFPFLAPIAAALAPSAIKWVTDKISGRGAGRSRKARLQGHELGFETMGSAMPSHSGGAMLSMTQRKVGGAMCGAAKPKRKPSARNEIVRQVMKERQCSLPQASRIVKEEGLY